MSPSRPASVLIKSLIASRIIPSCISQSLLFKASLSLSFSSSSSAACFLISLTVLEKVKWSVSCGYSTLKSYRIFITTSSSVFGFLFYDQPNYPFEFL